MFEIMLCRKKKTMPFDKRDRDREHVFAMHLNIMYTYL